MTGATPRPWNAPEGMGFAGGESYTGIDGPEGCVAWVLCNSRIPITGKDTPNPWEANAALIVRAVNAHDELVDVLERAHNICDSIGDGAEDASPLEQQALQLAGDIKAMLAAKS